MEWIRHNVLNTPLRARVIPFVVFVGLTLFQGQSGEAPAYWVYAGKTLLGVWLVWLMYPLVKEMRWGWSWDAVLAGAGVFALWVGLDGYYPRLGELGGAMAPLAERLGLGFLVSGGTGEAQPHWNPHAVFGAGSVLAWAFAVVRLVGSTLVVPPLEEVFYRSFVYRYVAQPDFMALPLGVFRWTPLLVTSAVFGFAHDEWLAGILCGLIYQGLVLRTKRLGDAMVAHAITNFLLGLWVMGRGQWQFW